MVSSQRGLGASARRVTAIVAMLWVGGCDPASLIPDLPTDTGDTDTTGPITRVNDDQASIVVAQFLPHTDDRTPRTQARAMFVENVRGYVNLAQCVGLRELWCATEWPANVGDVVRVEPFDDDVVEQLVGRRVGDPVTLGPLSLELQEDDSIGVPFYTKNYTDLLETVGPLELSVAGDWDPWTGDTVEAPTPMELLSHDPLVRHAFPSAEPLTLDWVPGTVGEVYLYLRTPNAQFVQKLDDTGTYQLDLRMFGLADGDPLDFYLGRWSTGDIDVEGHDVNVQVQSNQWLHGEYTALGNRTELDAGLLYDNCAEAEGAPFVESGLYYGDITGYTDDYQGAQTCLEGPAGGPDAILPLRLQADELLQVEYLQRADDAVMYVMEGLCEGAPQCLVAADDKGRTAQESLAYRNDRGGPLDVWLVLDTVQPIVDDIFELNIGIETAVANPLKSNCADALAQGPIDPGTYYGVMGTFPDLLDCSDTDGNASGAVGGDGKAQIYLLPNQTLTVDVFAPGAMPNAYLVYNCSISASCLTGVAGSGTDTATLTYTNTTGVSESVFLVVDSGVSGPGGAVQDYFLDIEIQ